jgi:hypothetical protein
MFEFIWGIIVLVHLGIALYVIMSMSRLGDSISALRAARWITLVAFVPIIGSVLWLWIGRPRVLREAENDPANPTQ